MRKEFLIAYFKEMRLSTAASGSRARQGLQRLAAVAVESFLRTGGIIQERMGYNNFIIRNSRNGFTEFGIVVSKSLDKSI